MEKLQYQYIFPAETENTVTVTFYITDTRLETVRQKKFAR